MTALLNVLEIVTERLTADGYDGLYNPDTGCACEVGHLAPCGEISGDCIASHRRTPEISGVRSTSDALTG